MFPRAEHKPLEIELFLLNRTIAVRPPEKYILLQWYVKSYTFQVFWKIRWAKEVKLPILVTALGKVGFCSVNIAARVTAKEEGNVMLSKTRTFSKQKKRNIERMQLFFLILGCFSPCAFYFCLEKEMFQRLRSPGGITKPYPRIKNYICV